MKHRIVLMIGVFLIGYHATINAQTTPKPSLTVLNIDAQNIELDAVQMGNLVRLELNKLDTFEVMDKYDVAYLVKENQLSIENCYGKICLLEVGKLLNADKMFTGHVERYGKNIIMTLRLIDVKKGVIEKTQVNEFLNLQQEMQHMIEITINDLFERKNDENLVKILTQKEALENAVTLPNEPRLNLSGPRMGISILTGEAADIYSASEEVGGFDAYPALFQFGYQFEIQYLNESNIQGLFEFIPLISGLEQGFFVPSVTILHGLRHNKYGIEFAFGPTITAAKYARGYYDADNVWHLKEEANRADVELTSRLDSRGLLEANTGFVIAAGLTFKSGKLNIPVNVYVTPRRNNFRYGISFGFNARR